jgi:ribonuclease D
VEAIATSSAARALIARLARADSVALDTEGDGMFRYRTRLCTLQLCADDEIAVVDTLAVPVAPLFSALLGENGPEKILHDASFDARVLFAHGIALGRVFDTAVAARFLGFHATGLSSLLLNLFGRHLPKHQQQADWGKRPLEADAMRYLQDDVRYLHELADALLTEVRERDIEAEVREECAYVLREARRGEQPDPPWTRMKNALTRPPEERARLYELAELREQLARAQDVPSGRLIPSDVIGRLAREPVPEGADIARLLGKQAQFAPQFEAALARAAALPDAPAEHLDRFAAATPSPSELVRRKRRKAWLMDFRDKEAKARDVDPQVVLPGHCLNDIVELQRMNTAALRAVSGFGEARYERYAERLLHLPD